MFPAVKTIFPSGFTPWHYISGLWLTESCPTAGAWIQSFFFNLASPYPTPDHQTGHSPSLSWAVIQVSPLGGEGYALRQPHHSHPHGALNSACAKPIPQTTFRAIWPTDNMHSSPGYSFPTPEVSREFPLARTHMHAKHTFFLNFLFLNNSKCFQKKRKEILIFGEENRIKKASFGVHFEIAILTFLNKTQGKRFDKDFHASSVCERQPRKPNAATWWRALRRTGPGLLKTKSLMILSIGDHSIIYSFCKGSEKSCSKKPLKFENWMSPKLIWALTSKKNFYRGKIYLT